MSTDTMVFKNPTSKPVNLRPIGLGVIPAGECVAVPLYLAAPIRLDNGARGPSSIEQCAPQMIPADEKEAEFWSQLVPPELERESLIVSVAGRAPTVPAGVQALRAAKAAEAVAEASEKRTVIKASTKPAVKME